MRAASLHGAVAIAARQPASCQQIAHTHAAADRAACNADLIAPRQREQQKPGVLERDARRRMHFLIGLVGAAQQRAGFQRAHVIARLDAARAGAHQAVHQEQAGELRRVEIELRVAEEERRLPRRLAAVAGDIAHIAVQDIASIQLADAIVAQARPLADRVSAGFVADQPQRKIKFLPVSRVSIVGHPHGDLPVCNSCVFGSKRI